MARRDKRGHPRGWLSPYPLPQDTVGLATRYSNRCQNLALWLDRFVTWEDETYSRREKSWVDKELSRSRDSDQRKAPMLNDETSGLLHWQGDQELLKNLKQRWQKMLRGYHCESFRSAPAWRFVVGLGGASVLETGMTLHRLYGIPIIPGSALKGLARAYAETIEGKEAHDPDVVAVFGKPPRSTPLESGEIIFFDAIPVTLPCFKLDVMTSHFPQYYQGSDLPADWQDPNPVYFLTVQDTKFLFAVAARREEGRNYVSTALNWLKKGLAELGVGAKTAAGYGYFEF